jgi:hypothetical protein
VVVVRGTNLTYTTKVLFGTTAGKVLTGSTSTALRVAAPPHAAGVVDVRVVTSYGTSRIVTGDQFTYVAPPTVTGVAPDTGPSSGGTTVTITGSDLSSVTSVRFGDVIASNVEIVSPTSLTVTAPAHAFGAVDVIAAGPYGSSAMEPADVYHYDVG